MEMLLRLLAVFAVVGTLPLPRQARAVSTSPFNRKAAAGTNRFSDSAKPQQTQKYPHQPAYPEYPDDYYMYSYYPQEAAAYPYYPYAAEPYYPAETAPSYYPKSFYPFDINTVPVPAYPYYFGLQTPYAYYPAEVTDRYSMDDEDRYRWYDNPTPSRGLQRDSNADVNAAFLRNLIVAQMYSDAATSRGHSPYVAPAPAPAPAPMPQVPQGSRFNQDFVYGEPVAYARSKEVPSRSDSFGRYVASRDDVDDDKDVRDLRSLIKSKKSDSRMSTRTLSGVDVDEDDYEGNELLEDVLGELYYKEPRVHEQLPSKDTWGPLLFEKDPLVSESGASEKTFPTSTSRAPTATRRVPHRGPITQAPAPATAPPAPAHTAGPSSGQKEEAMLRPSTHKSAHGPPRASDSVFDTIRHLLTMDRALSQHQMEPDIVPAESKRQPQKRYVMPEESLTEELSALKKIVT